MICADPDVFTATNATAIENLQEYFKRSFKADSDPLRLNRLACSVSDIERETDSTLRSCEPSFDAVFIFDAPAKGAPPAIGFQALARKYVMVHRFATVTCRSLDKIG